MAERIKKNPLLKKLKPKSSQSVKRVGNTFKTKKVKTEKKSNSGIENITNISIVGLGVSAGGLEVLELFFSHTPPNSQMAFGSN